MSTLGMVGVNNSDKKEQSNTVPNSIGAPGVYEPQSIGLESGICGLFQFHTFVTWEGEVLACCHDLTGATRIGSLLNDDVLIIAERKRTVLKDSMPFPVCGQCDETLRQCPVPQGLPPESRKERIRFFRSVSQEAKVFARR